jgi:hypothetical protein
MSELKSKLVMEKFRFKREEKEIKRQEKNVQPVRRKCSKSKGHNSVKNGSLVPKRELDLDIIMRNPCIILFNMCNQCKENEWKLQIIGIFFMA